MDEGRKMGEMGREVFLWRCVLREIRYIDRLAIQENRIVRVT